MSRIQDIPVTFNGKSSFAAVARDPETGELLIYSVREAGGQDGARSPRTYHADQPAEGQPSEALSDLTEAQRRDLFDQVRAFRGLAS